jgi:hypothetical protein
MDPHSIVVVSLHTPKEKVWGELLAINPSGVTMRGIDLNSFDHFVRGESHKKSKFKKIGHLLSQGPIAS